MVIEMSPLKPMMWLRYVNDTFIHLAPSRRCANTAGLYEVNHTVHNEKSSRSTVLPGCTNLLNRVIDSRHPYIVSQHSLANTWTSVIIHKVSRKELSAA